MSRSARRREKRAQFAGQYDAHVRDRDRRLLRDRQAEEERYLYGTSTHKDDGPFRHARPPHGEFTQPVDTTMLPRPEGMSRQVHRALYRRALKIAGVDYHEVVKQRRKAQQQQQEAA